MPRILVHYVRLSKKTCMQFDFLTNPTTAVGHAKVAYVPDNCVWLEKDEPANINGRNGMYAGPTVQVLLNL